MRRRCDVARLGCHARDLPLVRRPASTKTLITRPRPVFQAALFAVFYLRRLWTTVPSIATQRPIPAIQVDGSGTIVPGGVIS